MRPLPHRFALRISALALLAVAPAACRSKAARVAGTYAGTGGGSVTVVNPATDLMNASQQTFAAPLVVEAAGDARILLRSGECELRAALAGEGAATIEPGQSCTITVEGLGPVAVGPVGGSVTFAGDQLTLSWGAQHRHPDGRIVQVQRSFQGLRGAR
ncbi:MAG: hypothetical protein U0324_42975 [Polyangiales bacterium]